MSFSDFRKRKNEIDPEMDKLTEAIIGACIEVHRELGPGLNEKFYERALCYELELRNISFQQQVMVPVFYKDKAIGESKIDLLVDNRVIVELKACEALDGVHRAQLICYLSIMKRKVGLLVNFNVQLLVDGVKRVVVS